MLDGQRQINRVGASDAGRGRDIGSPSSSRAIEIEQLETRQAREVFDHLRRRPWISREPGYRSAHLGQNQ
jgi:hypothetical protein